MGNSPAVLCARFNNRGPSLVATGGSDNKVGVWRTTGAYTCLASLGGPTKPVTAVAFSPSPGTSSSTETIVGGDAAGTLRVWDLSRQQEIRLYNTSCHRGPVTRVDYHPFGAFFASTSTDGNVKIWDLRKKTCLQTYKYQEGKESGRPAVNFVKFSPDGRMVASGNADGTVILWDLTIGKRLHKITHHKSSITSMDFHPQEFILSVASSDGAVSFWDIENWSKISSTPPSSAPGGVLQVAFGTAGSALLAGTTEGLDVWGWGSISHHDQVVQPWGNIGAMSCGDEELYTATYTKSFVSIHSVKLSALCPFGNATTQAKGPAPSSSSSTSSSAPRKPVSNTARPATQESITSPLAPRKKEDPPAFEVRPASSGVVADDASFRSSASGSSSKPPSRHADVRSSEVDVLAEPVPFFGRRGTTPPAGDARYHDSKKDRTSSPTISRRRSEPTMTRQGGGLGGREVPVEVRPSREVQAVPQVTTQSLNTIRSETDAVEHVLADSACLQHILTARLTAVQTTRSLYFADAPEALRFLTDAAKADPGVTADVLAALAQPKLKKTLTPEVSWYVLFLLER